jgi:hypothetical protein
MIVLSDTLMVRNTIIVLSKITSKDETFQLLLCENFISKTVIQVGTKILL